MYLKLDPIDVIVNKIFEKREDTYMEIDAGKKYGIYEIKTHLFIFIVIIY